MLPARVQHAGPAPPEPASTRKINTRSFVRATRSTPREINRHIVLNLVREHQPISRADLARRMNVGRGMVTYIVDGLLTDRAIYEGASVHAPGRRKPKMLYVRGGEITEARDVVAPLLRTAVEQWALMRVAAATPAVPNPSNGNSRLRGERAAAPPRCSPPPRVA